jgi:hypothetical protein
VSLDINTETNDRSDGLVDLEVQLTGTKEEVEKAAAEIIEQAKKLGLAGQFTTFETNILSH